MDRVVQARLADALVEAFMDRWPDYPPQEVEAHWREEITAAFLKTLPAIEAQVLDRVRDHLLSDFAIGNILGTEAPAYVKDRLRREIKDALRPLSTLDQEGGDGA